MPNSIKKIFSLVLVLAFSITNIPVSFALLITTDQNKNSSSAKTAGQLSITSNGQNNQVNNQNALIGLSGAVGQPAPVAPQTNVIAPDRQPDPITETFYASGNLRTKVNADGSVDEFMDESLGDTNKGRRVKSTKTDGTVFQWTYYGGNQSNKIYNEKKFIKNVLVTEKVYNPNTDAHVYTIHFFSNGQRKEVLNHLSGDSQSYFENGNYKTMYFALSKTTWIYSEDNLTLRINQQDGSYEVTQSWSQENRRTKSYKKYDKDGNLMLSKQYDENGQEIAPEDPNITRYASGNLKTRINSDGTKDEFLDEDFYGDKRGRISTKTLSTGNAYKLTYHGNTEKMMTLEHYIQGVKNALFVYDTEGKNKTTTYFYPSGARKAFNDYTANQYFTFYENGRYETITTSDGTKYFFTSDYSQLRIEHKDGSSELNTYWNSNFQLKSQSRFDKDGKRLFANAFDQKSRLTRHDKGDNSHETYEYWGDTATVKTQKNYDANGQLVSTKNYDQQGKEIIDEPDSTRYPSGNLKIRENADGSIDELMDENYYGDKSGRIAKKSYGTNYYLYTYHPNSDKAQSVEYYPLGGPKLTLTTHDITGKKLTETVFYSTGVKKKFSDFVALEFINYYESGKVWTSTKQGVTSTFNEDGLITKKEQVDRSYETFAYWPNKVLKTHTKFDRNNVVLSKKEYDENGNEILPGPALDKTKVLKSIELAIQDVMGGSAAEYWFFDLNSDKKIDALDMTLFKNWEALPQQEFIRIYTMIWSAIDSLKMDDSGGHHHHSSGDEASPLDLDGDGMIMDADKKALEIMISTAQKDILTATVKALESATAAHHTATAGHAPYLFQSTVKANPNLKIFEVVFKSGADEAKYLVMLGNTPDQISIKTLAHAHADNAQKAGEHEALFNLVKIQDATNAVVKSGNWSDASIWADGKVPATNAKIWIPAGIVVTYDVDNANLRLETVRVDGTLNFATDKNTTMKVETLVVDPSGKLTIGTADKRVAADKKARIIIADRGVWDYTYDPIDIGGGVISHGQMLIYGAEHTSFMDPITDLKAGVKEISFATAPKDWKVGDKIIVPSTTLGGTDEEYTIVQMKNGGTTIVLDKELQQDRNAPDGLKVPIGNLTRNVVIESESLETSRRGHVMLMHKPGNIIDSAAFNNLGRTTHEHLNDIKIGTDGKPVPGTSTNQRGRYSLHFHRNGATLEAAPNIVRNVAVDGGLKWGIVNHDSKVDVQYNVTYNINGAHFATEVGTELGVFAHNLAVKSNGSKTRSNDQSRVAISDFGHAGHGIWLQGTLTFMHDNFAFGHSDAAFFLGPWEMKENGQQAKIKVEYLSILEPYIPGLKEWKESLLARGITLISNADAPHYFSNLYAAASKHGFTTWDHFRRNFDDDTTPNFLVDSIFWNMGHSGVQNHYGKRMTFKNVRVYRNYPTYLGNVNNDHAAGFEVNAVTEDTTYDNVYVFGFMYGIGYNYIGKTTIKNSYIDSHLMYYARLATSHGRIMTVTDTTFGPNMKAVSGYHVDYNQDQAQSRLDLMFSIRDTILFENITWGGGKELALNDRQHFPGTVHPDWIPVRDSALSEINGKTNQQLWDQYRLWLGGGAPPVDARIGLLYTNPHTVVDRHVGHGFTLMPIDTEKFPAVYVGKSGTDKTHTFSTNQLNGYVPHIYDVEGRLLSTGPAVNLKEGWNIIQVTVKGERRGFLVYGDITPATVKVTYDIPAETYPGAGSRNPETNRSYGIPVYIALSDIIGGKDYEIVHRIRTVPFPAPGRELTHARIEFEVPDAAGNMTSFTLDIPYPGWYLELIRKNLVNPLTMTRDTL